MPAVRARWLEGFGWRHLAMIVGFALGAPALSLLLALASGETVELPFVAYEIAACFAIGAATLLSTVAVDNRLGHRVGSAWRAALATGIAAIGATLLIQVLDLAIAQPLGLEQRMAMHGRSFASEAHRLLFQFSGALRWALMLVVLHVLFESNRRAQDELHGARLAALAAERDLIDGQLRTMQARVDPDLLFDSLHDIHRAYELDPVAGQARLDALIRYLRAALPANDAGGSSVPNEKELIEAYVDLAGTCCGRRVELTFAVPPEACRESIPAMTLLPLTRWALAGWAAAHLHIAVRRTPESLVIRVNSHGSGRAEGSDAELDTVRERLMRLYDGSARLESAVADQARAAILTIPLAGMPPGAAALKVWQPLLSAPRRP